MKKKRLLVCLLMVWSISGCAVSTKLPDQPIVYEADSNGEYLYLSDNGKTYVPYCPFKKSYLGDCIGYYASPADEYTESARIYIYAFKGYSSAEWIVDYDPDINEGMVMREIHATVIPEGLESEYEWNQST